MKHDLNLKILCSFMILTIRGQQIQLVSLLFPAE